MSRSVGESPVRSWCPVADRREILRAVARLDHVKGDAEDDPYRLHRGGYPKGGVIKNLVLENDDDGSRD